MTDREAFDTWALSPAPDAWWGLSERERLFLAWQAATAAERERCAKVCESLRDTISDPLVIGEDACHAGHNALQSAADAIRKRE